MCFVDLRHRHDIDALVQTIRQRTEQGAASTVGHRHNDFADGVRAAVPGADIQIGPGLDPRGLGPRRYYRMDISRAQGELGYAPRYDPEGAVRDWIEWTERLELTQHDRNHDR